MGGLSKKAHQQETIAREKGLPVIKADAGALFFKLEHLPPASAAQEKAAAEGIGESYAAMKYDALGIAREDLAAGLPFLLSLRERFHLPLLSANLVGKSTGKPLFERYVIRDLGGVKVGITALTDPEARNRLSDEDDATVLGWSESLPKLIEELRAKAGMIILLSTLPQQESMAIARDYDSIHVLVQGGYGPNNLGPNLHNNTLICQVVGQGKYMGGMEITWRSSGKWRTEDPAGAARMKQAELDRLLWQVTRMEKEGEPETLYQQDPDRLAYYRNLKERQKELEAAMEELRRREEELSRPGTAPSVFDNQFVAMELNLPDDPGVLKIVEKTKEKVNELGRTMARSVTASGTKGVVLQGGAQATASGEDIPPPRFVGWQRCAACHVTETEKWKNSRHARAYQTLVAKKQEFNARCVSCHVTGMLSGPDAFSAATLTEDMKAVGCEVCHGPGEHHIIGPTVHHLEKKPAAGLCLRCHTPEQDDAFDYDKKVKLLQETGH